MVIYNRTKDLFVYLHINAENSLTNAFNTFINRVIGMLLSVLKPRF